MMIERFIAIIVRIPTGILALYSGAAFVAEAIVREGVYDLTIRRLTSLSVCITVGLATIETIRRVATAWISNIAVVAAAEKLKVAELAAAAKIDTAKVASAAKLDDARVVAAAKLDEAHETAMGLEHKE